MFVQFWGVGAATPSVLPMTVQDVCGHLANDWIPSLPATVSSSFIGWPPFLIETVSIDGSEFLALQEVAGRSDRQWKGVLSWMIGVAGARCFLKFERYRWIAPLSAFYPNTKESVDLAQWNVLFPPSRLVIDRAQGVPARLRPDYIALRPGNPLESNYEWAVAESKGTSRCLSNRTDCPLDWYNQAHNVHIELDGVPLTVQRHLVVATRVNPAASSPSKRRLQLRAWNSKEDAESTALPVGAAVDVASAHLFGFFKTLHLRENVRALALATRSRTVARRGFGRFTTSQDLEKAVALADEELRAHSRRLGRESGEGGVTLFVETDFGAVEVEISAPTMNLARNLQRARSDEAAQTAFRKADSELNEWSGSQIEQPKELARVDLPFGVRLFMPRYLERRDR